MKKRPLTVEELHENLRERSYSYQGMVFKQEIVPSMRPIMHRYIPSPLKLNEAYDSSIEEIKFNLKKCKRNLTCDIEKTKGQRVVEKIMANLLNEVDFKKKIVKPSCKKRFSGIFKSSKFNKIIFNGCSKKFLLEKEEESMGLITPKYNKNKLKRIEQLLKHNYVILSNNNSEFNDEESCDCSQLSTANLKATPNEVLENDLGKISILGRTPISKYSDMSSDSSNNSNVNRYKNDIDLINKDIKLAKKGECIMNNFSLNNFDEFHTQQLFIKNEDLAFKKSNTTILKKLQSGYCSTNNKFSTDCISTERKQISNLLQRPYIKELQLLSNDEGTS